MIEEQTCGRLYRIMVLFPNGNMDICKINHIEVAAPNNDVLLRFRSCGIICGCGILNGSWGLGVLDWMWIVTGMEIKDRMAIIESVRIYGNDHRSIKLTLP